MVVLDTSVLIDVLTAGQASPVAGRLRRLIADGERLAVPALVFYEFLRGPRLPAELTAQEALFPIARALQYGPVEASLSARLYREVPRGRGREIDLAIAASAIAHDAALWTLSSKDFSDIPGLRLLRTERRRVVR